MKKYSYLILSLCMLAAIALGSCSRSDNDILKTIPADATLVSRIDAEALLESAGCKKDGGKWALGGTLERLAQTLTTNDRDELDNFLSAIPVIDANNIYIFNYKDRVFATCAVNHPQVLADALEKNVGRPEKHNGFKVYDNQIVMRDNQVWATENIDALTAALDAAGIKSAADVKALSKTLEASGTAVSSAISYNGIFSMNPYISLSMPGAEQFKDKYISMHMTFKGNIAESNGSILNDEGEAVSFCNSCIPVDDSFTEYIPSNTLLAVAMGNPGEEGKENLSKYLANVGAEDIVPYIKAVDGTTAIAIAPPADFKSLLKLSEWTFTVAIGYDKNKADELTELAGSLSAHGMNVQELADQIRVNVPGGLGAMNPADFYIGYFDGMLIASTRRIAESGSKNFAGFFNGYYSAGFIDLPATGEIASRFGMPFGLKGDMVSDEKTYKAKLELEGSKMPFIESIINAATDDSFHRRFLSTLNELNEQE